MPYVRSNLLPSSLPSFSARLLRPPVSPVSRVHAAARARIACCSFTSRITPPSTVPSHRPPRKLEGLISLSFKHLSYFEKTLDLHDYIGEGTLSKKHLTTR